MKIASNNRTVRKGEKLLRWKHEAWDETQTGEGRVGEFPG